MNVLFILFVQDFKAIHPTVVDEFQSSLRYDDTLVIHREIYWILHMWRSCNAVSCYCLISYCFPSGEDGSESHAETPSSETSRESRSYQTCTNTALKVLGGLLMVLCVSSSWVGTTQLVKLTFQSFSCPFFISWFSSNWNILFFPIYYSGHVVITREKQTPIQKFRYC